MNIFVLLSTCIRSIARNRMRSFLTSLGIIIGVGSVIIMLAVGEGTQANIEEQLSTLGTNLLQISPARVRMGPGTNIRPRRVWITNNDLAKVHSEVSYAAAVTGVSQGSFTVVGTGEADSITVMGVEPDYLKIRSREAEHGVMFDDADGEERNRVAVIGTTTAVNLYGSVEAALGQRLRIGALPFTVTGILKSAGTSGGSDQDDLVWVPLQTFQTRLTNSRNVSQIMVQVISKEYMTAEQTELEAILREAHGLSAGAPNDFDIMNSADMIEMATSIMGMLTTLLAAIAGVSLLVGGIGIMNIMLVSVTERTREIGIRMAVGAKKRDILLQFLAESVLLSLSGGILGILLAAGACRGLEAAVSDIHTLINPMVVLLAAGFAAFVGVFFGFYPAQKAAKLYPIDALRYE
jgi:putative ABC transport system permease protein